MSKGEMQRRHGPVSGFRVGMLVLNTSHQLVRGNLQNASTFRFPIQYHVVRGVPVEDLMAGSEQIAGPILEGARALESGGVQIIAGACGSFANYQRQVAAAVDIPVLMSILLEVPLLLRCLPPNRKLAIIFARVSSFTARVQKECNIESTDRIVAVGADAIEAFKSVLEGQEELDSLELETGLVALAERTLREHPDIGAWLIQCSDLPPYSRALALASGLPVFDMVGLLNRVHEALMPCSFSHGNPW